MPEKPRRPLFVPSGSVPPDEGWRLAHGAADTFDRSTRAAVSEVSNTFQRQPMGAFERALGRGSRQAVATLDWKGYEADLRFSLQSRMRGVVDDVAGSSRIAGLEPDLDVLRKLADRRARQAARIITRESRRGAVEATKRLRRAGLTPRQVSQRTRPLLGLGKRQVDATLNKMFAMEVAGAPLGQQLSELRKLGKEKLLSRAAGISRFENLGAATDAQQQLARQAVSEGVAIVASRIWVATLDVTHKNCARLDGQITGVDQPFVDTVTGRTIENPPLHKYCQCGVQYVLVEQTEAAA